jgi:hypothetical protein
MSHKFILLALHPGSASPRGGLLCYHVVLCPWSHPDSALLRGGLPYYHVATCLRTHPSSTSLRDGLSCCHPAPSPWLRLSSISSQRRATLLPPGVGPLAQYLQTTFNGSNAQHPSLHPTPILTLTTGNY